MKIFKFIVCSLMTALCIYSGYIAFTYKAHIAFTMFGLAVCCTAIVFADGGLKKNAPNQKKS